MNSLLSVILGASQALSAPSQASLYEINFPDTTGSMASVVASIDIAGETLAVRNGGNDLPRGFATFVKLKAVRDENGRQVGFREDSVSRWKLDKRVARATVDYDVHFVFAHDEWPSGNEQAGRWESGSLYTVTKPLFVTGSTDGPFEVTFRLPGGWKVATPWRPLAGKPNSFAVDNEASLTDNSIVLGRFRADNFRTGPFTFTLVTLGKTASSAPFMSRVLGLVAREYLRVFPSTPGTAYLMTVFSGSENDGEAFAQSFAFRTLQTPRESNSIMWGTTLAHELFHFWNGHLMRGTDAVESAWFSEGVTEYYANRTLLRTGALPASQFLAKAENMAGLYSYFRTQPMFDSVSLATAGSRRTRYRFGVYNGGWAVGFALDRQISRATSGRANLDDVMRELFKAHPSPRTPYSPEEIASIASRISATDFTPFFTRYVYGRDLLPMRELFNDLGIEADFISYTGEGYFRFSLSATPAQLAEWNRFSNGRERVSR